MSNHQADSKPKGQRSCEPTLTNLSGLIADLRQANSPESSYIEVIVGYEPRLYLYIVEERESRTILRYGSGKEFILANNDFRWDFKPDEWLSYLESRRKACLELFEQIHASILEDTQYVELSPKDNE